MWVYFLFSCLTLTAAVLIRLKVIKVRTRWDRSPTCLVGKTAIVTGANCGLGFYTAQDLAKRGARVILACRSRERAEAARRQIVRATHNQNVHVRIVDFASLKSVREFAKEINSSEERLDILVNNAGALIFEDDVTEDGLSKFMQVNHFGPFLLTELLIDLLKKSKPSRIVYVSSSSVTHGQIHLDNLNYSANSRIARLTFSNYANSKLCHLATTNELAKRLRGSGITVNSLDPGTVRTEVTRNLNIMTQGLFRILASFFKISEEGAQTSIYLAVSDDVQDVTGKYFYNCALSEMPSTAIDSTLNRKVWEKSAELVHLTHTESTL
ncbi:hypothetical protein PPYR_07726 [Photinus pyralis]|uniref:Uncharacterized protein n=1 Tax=Photinus pyralis TaxID=7054 RepID=A0A1Y1LAJ4_PHOPY|nr:retinol dehydrogenase 11-like [Photinus pyralis]XP_031342117.1 retinol dehydrogenase 11-like [Photinus pyralis]KAB0799021.1 hypothetical protein PPYR_06901 [Photinus pyralis]KAB0799846.1 hypothetical protein PPYR_07726 [Photinus pyralis]